MMASNPLTPATGSPRLGSLLHRDVWTVQDRLSYRVYATALARFIRDRDTQAPFVIAVQGPWGQGKTSFLRMIQNYLDPAHPDLNAGLKQEREEATARLSFGDLKEMLAGRLPLLTEKLKFPTVWFNAWNHQSSEQLWAGLAHCILQQLARRLETIEKRELFWLRLQLTRIEPEKVRKEIYSSLFEKLLPSLAVAVVLLLVGVTFFLLVSLGFPFPAFSQWVAISAPLLALIQLFINWLRARSKALSEKLKGTYVQLVRQPEYRDRQGSLPLIQEDVSRALELLVDPHHPAVVFIDDLDRCSPANVAEIIGAINLFLAGSSPHCVFILGMDTEVVAASMEVAHEKIISKLGERRGELGWSYMDKFIQLPFVLPRISNDGQNSYLDSLVDGLEPFSPVQQTMAEEPGEAQSASATSILPKAILLKQRDHLSENPRTLKRVINLFRFHKILQNARRDAKLPAAEPDEKILAWAILLARWPFFVRWLQRLRRQTSQPPQGRTLDRTGATDDEAVDRILQTVIQRAQMTDNPQAWAKELEEEGIEHGGWTSAPGLFEFLRNGEELHLEEASNCGFW